MDGYAFFLIKEKCRHIKKLSGMKDMEGFPKCKPAYKLSALIKKTGDRPAQPIHRPTQPIYRTNRDTTVCISFL